jgi:hypothetical protein
MKAFFSRIRYTHGTARRCLSNVAIILCAFLTIQCSSSDPQLPVKEIKELKAAIKDAPKFRQAKEERLDSAKEEIDKIPTYDLEARSRVLLEIGKEYHAYNADSALNYFHKAEVLATNAAKPDLMNESKICIMDALSSSGIFPEACAALEKLEAMSLKPELKIKLWLAARQLYAYMTTYLGQKSNFAEAYHKKYLQYDDSLLNALPHDDLNYRFINAERKVELQHYKEAKDELLKLLAEVPLESNIYGKAAYQMAMVYQEQGDEQNFSSYLTKAAISDVKGCVNEGWALPMLGAWLYEHNDLDNAYNFIIFSLNDAMTGNARMRTATIAQVVPNIDDAYRKKLDNSNSELRIYIGLVTFLLITSAILLTTVMRQMKQSRVAQEKLAETSRLQESYLGNFVALCSSYSAKLDSWQKTVTRKINAGQTEELMRMIKSGKITDETEDFHTIIDRTFLELYPDFVEKVNELLREGEEIKLKKPGVLPAELRIYALIRLGVDESTRIASILQYSANTVYTYRNKMRNKAINRETFESDILKIGYDF